MQAEACAKKNPEKTIFPGHFKTREGGGINRSF